MKNEKLDVAGILAVCEEEIESSKQRAAYLNIHLIKAESGNYKSFLKQKIEGDYILQSTALEKEVVVQINYHIDHIIVGGIESELEAISATITEDNTAILRAIVDKIKNSLAIDPAFIIGPPGTGKTHVILKIIREALAKGLKILLLSPTNMAVENAGERINPSEFGLEDGEFVLSIKTELEDLQELHPDRIRARKLAPIEDEIEILEEAKLDMHQKRRDSAPERDTLKHKAEQDAIRVSNFNKDLSQLNSKLKKAQAELKGKEHQINSLTGNAILKTVASIFMSKKVEQLEIEKESIVKEVKSAEQKIVEVNKKIVQAQSTHTQSKKSQREQMAELAEIENALVVINQRLKELRATKEELANNNVFKKAKLVGATLVGAALNKKILEGNFDLIIVDEASMALVPTLLAASQALREIKEDEEVAYVDNYVDSPDLYQAQNDAVRLALSKRIIFVGDPKQLSPIANTYEMKRSVFSLYGVEDIFDGVEVKNSVMLDINFRNHPDITALASRIFYGGLLKSGREHDGKSSMYIRQSSSNMVMKNKSFINYGNMEIIHEQVERALERGRRSIGVISPYRQQAELINESFHDLRETYPDADLQAGTVHKFQGKESATCWVMKSYPKTA